PFGHPQTTIYENGTRSEVIEWFAGTDTARQTITRDRHGNIVERSITKPDSQFADGISLDGVSQFRVGRSGYEAPVGGNDVIPGTEILYFYESGTERTYFDWRKLYSSPRCIIDQSGRDGSTVAFDGSNRTHVVSVLTSELIQPASVKTNFQYAEPVAVIQAIYLRSLFFQKVTHQVRDRA